MRSHPWLRPHFEQLISTYQSGQGHYALLLQSLPGLGASILLDAIVHLLLCQQPQKQKKCGKCHGCQLIKAGTHPDYYIIKAEKDKTELGVDAIRFVREKIYEHSLLGGEKVIRINNAMLLTEAAANALLKTLEEPPEKTWFFLSCSDSKQLLITLRSRCRLYRLTVPEEAYAVNWIQEQKIEAPQNTVLAVLRLCSGAPIAALKLLQEKYLQQRMQLFLKLCNVLKSSDWFSLLPLLNHTQAPLFLHWMIAILLDVLKIQYGISTIINVDAMSEANKLATLLSENAIHDIIHVLYKCRKCLLTINGINRELILTNLLLFIEHYLQTGTVLPFHYF